MPLNARVFFSLNNFPFKELFQEPLAVYSFLKEPLNNFCQGFLGRQIKGTLMPGAYLEGEGIFIDEGTIVEPTAYIKGPCIIGKNCQIRHGAYLRGNVVLGNNCIVGHASEVKNSIFLNGAKAAHFAYVGDSILGENVNLGAGTKLANLKIIPGEIVLNLEQEKILTGLKKMGAILGDHVEIGCNTVLSPGTILAKNSLVFPAIGVKGVFLKKIIIRQSNMN